MIRTLFTGAMRPMGGNRDHLNILVGGLIVIGCDTHPVLAALYVVGSGLWICLESLDEWDLENW